MRFRYSVITQSLSVRWWSNPILSSMWDPDSVTRISNWFDIFYKSGLNLKRHLTSNKWNLSSIWVCFTLSTLQLCKTLFIWNKIEFLCQGNSQRSHGSCFGERCIRMTHSLGNQYVYVFCLWCISDLVYVHFVSPPFECLVISLSPSLNICIYLSIYLSIYLYVSLDSLVRFCCTVWERFCHRFTGCLQGVSQWEKIFCCFLFWEGRRIWEIRLNGGRDNTQWKMIKQSTICIHLICSVGLWLRVISLLWSCFGTQTF